jgi:FKBP-type peptidyl-prolyl cis-trans isomerase
MRAEYLICFFCFLIAGCGSGGSKPSALPAVDGKRLMNINKYMVDKDIDVMKHLIERKSWKMTFADEGFFHEIFDSGNDPKIRAKTVVTCDCKISLPDGTLCYELKNKTFAVEGSEEIAGLHKAVKLLGKGGRARFMFPPHLAYGLQGDLDKIPPRSILLYEIRIRDAF